MCCRSQMPKAPLAYITVAWFVGYLARIGLLVY